jgi:DNA-binding MarR family transcriptional regulator
MKVERTVARLVEANTDSPVLRHVGRDVAHELPRNRLDLLSDFRARVAALPAEGVDRFALGYRHALLDLVAGYEAAVEPEVEAEHAARVAGRLGLRRVLLALAEGPARPSELADRLGIDKSAVSRALKELRAADLAEMPGAEGDDGRSRVHRLTLKGEAVARRLQPELPPELRAVVRLSLSFFVRLVAEGRVSRQFLDTNVDQLIGPTGLDGARVGELLLAECRQWGLVLDDPAGWSRPDLASESAISQALQRAIDTAEEPSFYRRLRQGAPDGSGLIVRSGQVNRWNVFWSVAGRSFPDFRALAGGELHPKLIEVPERPFVLLYESVPLLNDDRLHHPSQGELERAAIQRVCLVSSEREAVPAGYAALPVNEASV